MQEVTTYITLLQQTIEQLPKETIVQVIDLLHSARMSGRQMFIMGNGGSASTATHFVCDLAKNTRKDGWPHCKVIGLSDNMAIFSAYANDEGYENVFSQQLANLVMPDDIVIAISASGNSGNILNAIMYAKSQNALTIGFTGFDGGRLVSIVDINLHVNSNIIEHIEDIHLMLEHMIVKSLKERVQTENMTKILLEDLQAPQ
ncbi:MAG TPA: SIS domain-containing protein [Anaerolineales bacterium]|nr:SIS domain-containing protein [Anaerolineales bacterium]